MLKNYICPWCTYNFNQEVSFIESENNPRTHLPGKKQSLSTQVVCPKCRGAMPTWDKVDLGDGKFIKVRK